MPLIILMMLNCERSAGLDGLVMANRKAVFNVRAFNDRFILPL